MKNLTKKKPLLTRKPRQRNPFSDALFVAEVEVGDATETTLPLKPAQLGRHVVTSLVILLLKKKLMKKSPLLTKTPRLTQFSDARFAAEGEGDAETATSLSKLVQLDRHVVTSLAILPPMKTKRLLKKTLFSDVHFAAGADAGVATETT